MSLHKPKLNAAFPNSTPSGRKYTPKSISTRLRVKLRYSRKVAYEKATQQIAQQKANFITSMNRSIFLDESDKEKKAARRKYGWSPVGISVNYRALFNMDTRFTFIGVADCFGFVIPACDVVLHRYKEKEEHKPVNTERFEEYVELKLKPIWGSN